MTFGYARVSTKGQDRYGNSKEAQQIALTEAGADKVFYDSFTGTKKHRPALDEMLSVLSAGDTVLVTKLDRIARNTRDGIDIIDSIVDKGCAVRILNMGMFDNTPTGKLMRTMMLAFAEFERDMIVQRTAEGKAIARQREDFREGRPTLKVDFSKIFEKEKDGISVSSLCEEYGISRASYYRHKKQMAEGAA